MPKTPVAVQGGTSVALVASFVRGATAAGVGLGLFSVFVTVTWISSPFPGSGPADALHVAAALWLLAHGTELVRADTLSGTPAPVGIVPLLLVVVPAWLAYRAARDSLQVDEGRPKPSAWAAPTMVASGYVMVGAPSVLYVAGGSFTADPLSALFHLPLVTFAAAAFGAWTASGRPLGPLPVEAPHWLRVALARTRASVALRSSVAGTFALVGGGALLVAASTVWHGRVAQESLTNLSGEWSGRVALVLLALALVPNAAVWAASYGLGPGFAVGTGATVTPFVLTGPPAMPDFPLLAAVPGQGAGTPLHWAATAVPVVAAAVVAWFTVGTAAPRYGERETAWSPGATAVTVLLGASGCAVLMALLAAASAGPLGTGRLAEFGPSWWLTGPAALVWTAGVGIPLALGLRAWRLRTPLRGWLRVLTRRGEKAGTKPQAPEASAVPAGPVPAAETPSNPPEPADAGPDLDAEAGPDDEFEPYDFLPADTWAERGAGGEGRALPKGVSGGLLPDGTPAQTQVGAGHPGPEPAARPTALPQARPDPRPVSGPERGSGPEAVSGPEPVFGPEAVSEPDSGPDASSAAEARPAPEPGLAPGGRPVSDPNPLPDPSPLPEPYPASESHRAARPHPAAEPPTAPPSPLSPVSEPPPTAPTAPASPTAPPSPAAPVSEPSPAPPAQGGDAAHEGVPTEERAP